MLSYISLEKNNQTNLIGKSRVKKVVNKSNTEVHLLILKKILFKYDIENLLNGIKLNSKEKIQPPRFLYPLNRNYNQSNIW